MNFFVFIISEKKGNNRKKQPIIISCEYSDDAIRRRTYSAIWMFQWILNINIPTFLPYWQARKLQTFDEKRFIKKIKKRDNFQWWISRRKKIACPCRNAPKWRRIRRLIWANCRRDAAASTWRTAPSPRAVWRPLRPLRPRRDGSTDSRIRFRHLLRWWPTTPWQPPIRWNIDPCLTPILPDTGHRGCRLKWLNPLPLGSRPKHPHPQLRSPSSRPQPPLYPPLKRWNFVAWANRDWPAPATPLSIRRQSSMETALPAEGVGIWGRPAARIFSGRPPTTANSSSFCDAPTLNLSYRLGEILKILLILILISPAVIITEEKVSN